MALLLIFLFILIIQQLAFSNDQQESKYNRISNLAGCWTKGEWVYNESHTPLFIDHQGEHTNCRQRESHTDYINSLKWQWEVQSSCTYKIPDRRTFCETLNGRNILIVGDSTSWTFASTIMDFAVEYKWIGSQFDAEPVPVRICKSSDLLFIRNDILSLVQRNEVMLDTVVQDGNIVEFSWIDHLLSGKYEIVIFNRGAHYFPDPILKDNLKLLGHYLNDTTVRNKTTIFYRNTVAGHHNCENFTKPDNNNKYVDSDVKGYHWHNFARQNIFVIKYMKSIGAYIIDANATSFFRPDHHLGPGDCLHYCIPGPVDTWLIFFWNLLALHDALQVVNS